MARVSTKTLASYSLVGYRFTKEPVDVPYHLAVQLSEDPKASSRLKIEISAQEHVENHGKKPPEPVAAAASAPADPAADPGASQMAAIKAAIDSLDIDNEAHYTKGGLPDARALSSILGFQVTAKMRDEAMALPPGVSGDGEDGTEDDLNGSDAADAAAKQDDADQKPEGTTEVKAGGRLVIKRGGGAPEGAADGAKDPSTEGAQTV